MRATPVRYIKATIFLSLFVCLLVAGLYESGVFHQLDIGLASFLGKNFTPAPARAVQYPLFILLTLGVVWTSIDLPRLTLKTVIAAGALLQTLTAVWVLPLGTSRRWVSSPAPNTCSRTRAFRARARRTGSRPAAVSEPPVRAGG